MLKLSVVFLVVVAVAVAGINAELMSRFGDTGDFMLHRKRLYDARQSLYDTMQALDRLSTSPVMANGMSTYIEPEMLSNVKRHVGEMADAALQEEKRVCVVNLGGACNAEDALKNARMRAFLDSANGPGRR